MARLLSAVDTHQFDSSAGKALLLDCEEGLSRDGDRFFWTPNNKLCMQRAEQSSSTSRLQRTISAEIHALSSEGK